ncbi:MAG TPA: DUF2062 domain-containing protein [Noviherbaspirillum sp.]|nr:DUF2062 domain-containing protein [Noviherbaspirillum sp.]
MLKPFARYLEHHALWQFNRRAVAGGVALGLFFGILIPFAQILVSAVVAIFVRVNLPVAAFSTLITNPLTFPAVYYLAYQVGGIFLHEEQIATAAAVETHIQYTMAVRDEVLTGWLAPALDWLQTAGLQLIVGLAVLAVVASAVGYVAVNASWRYWVRQRWRKRRLRLA